MMGTTLARRMARSASAAVVEMLMGLPGRYALRCCANQSRVSPQASFAAAGT